MFRPLLKFWCRKFARRCSEKHICKSKCTFSSSGVEKLHAAVARTTFSSQNVQNTSGADRFLKFRCGKIARRCSEKHFSSQNVQNTAFSDHFLKCTCGKIARRCREKHIFKSKCQKTEGYGPLCEVQMWKNGTPL